MMQKKNKGPSTNGEEAKGDSWLPCSFLVSKSKKKKKKDSNFMLCDLLARYVLSFFAPPFPFLLFIVVLSALDNMGFVANMVSIVLYFYGVMHFDLASSANTLTNFMGSTYLLSLVGGFISDTYLNRFTTCLLFGSLEVLVSDEH